MKRLWLRILWEIVGVLQIVAGIVCICNPEFTMTVLAWVFGLSMLISGIVDIVIFIRWNHYIIGVGWFLFDGILTIIFSFFLMFRMGFTTLSLPIIFGMWILFTGINRFVLSYELQRFGVRGWGWMTAVGIIMTIVGFFAFFDPIIGALTMTTFTGILLIVRGIVSISQSIYAGRYLH